MELGLDAYLGRDCLREISNGQPLLLGRPCELGGRKEPHKVYKMGPNH